MHCFFCVVFFVVVGDRASPPLAPPELLKKSWMKLLMIEDKTLAVDSPLRGLGYLSWERRANKKTPALAFIISQIPPSVPSSATVASPIEWVFVRDANVFMGDVPWVKPPFIHRGNTHTGLECGLQLKFENTENDLIACCLAETIEPLLMSVTHGASGL